MISGIKRRTLFKLLLLYLLLSGIFFNIYLKDRMRASSYEAGLRRNASECVQLNGIRFSHEFVVLTSIEVPEVNPDFNDVTIATQLDITRLRDVITLSAAWNGPLQVAVLIPKIEILPRLLKVVQMIRYCHQHVNRYVGWHVAMPLSAIEGLLLYAHLKVTCLKRLKTPVDCSVLEPFAKDLKNERCRREAECREEFYPVNIMRNIARRSARTKFIFSLDSDLIPSANLRQSFLKFAQICNLFPEKNEHSQMLLTRTNYNCFATNTSKGAKELLIGQKDVFIIPTFEVGEADKVTEMPNTFHGLRKEFFKTHKAQPFHHWCPGCYSFTNHERFLNESSAKPGVLDLAYTVQFHEYYEPYHISINSAPFYDERFKGYGFNKASQIYELAAAGYRFSVVRGAFLLHKGWKKKTTGKKWIEQRRNAPLFHAFKWEVKKRYRDRP